MSKRSIPSLDGLRAISILFVIVGHEYGTAFTKDSTLAQVGILLFGNANLGVDIFFGISGFLITTLLVKEWNREGRLDLPKFYLRRAFRIFPAFYLYLGSLLVLGALGLVVIYPTTWLSSAFYLRNYYPALGAYDDWLTQHAWSLAVEEQFYLFWPLLVAILGPRRSAWLAAGLIALSPAIRIATYLLLPATRGNLNYMMHTRLDAIMVGCVAAILFDSPKFQELLRKAFRIHLPIIAAIFLLLVAPILKFRFGGFYRLLIGYTLESFSIMLVLLWLVIHPKTVVGRLLNTRPMVHVGTISYSLYLWQQMGLHSYSWATLPATLLLAEFSYHVVERPFLRLRDAILRGKAEQPAAAQATINMDAT